MKLPEYFLFNFIDNNMLPHDYEETEVLQKELENELEITNGTFVPENTETYSLKSDGSEILKLTYNFRGDFVSYTLLKGGQAYMAEKFANYIKRSLLKNML